MEKVIFSYKDLGLIAYLIVNGNEFKGYELKLSKKFNEYKLYGLVEGYKEQLISMTNYYNENKLLILKTKTIKDTITTLSEKVEISLKNKEGNNPQTH